MIINKNLPPVGMNPQRTGQQSYNLSNNPIFGNDGMPTKGISSMNDEKFKTAIEEMAKRHVAAGYNLSQAHHSAEYKNLCIDYMSAESPDRKGMINSTLSSLSGRLKSMFPELNMSRNRFCLLQMLMQKSNYFPNNRNIGNNFINFTDASGNIIAMYSELPPSMGGGMGWTHVPTLAEQARSKEFASIYLNAWQAARHEPARAEMNAITSINLVAAGHDIDIAQKKAGGTPLDMAKLAKYGITLDNETGQTVVDRSLLPDSRVQYSWEA